MLVSETSKDRGVLEGRMPMLLRTKISRGAFIADCVDDGENRYFSIGISYPEFIHDEGASPLLTYIPITGLGTASIKKEHGTYRLTVPDRDDIFKEFSKRKRDLILRAENLLIESATSRFIDIPNIQNGLNPIREILVSLNELDEIPLRDILSRKENKRQMQRYVDMLASLKFIILRDDMLYPGEEMEKFKMVGSSDIEGVILTDVLDRSYHFLRDELNIYALTPYLELTNAYYLPSLLAEEKVHMGPKNVYHYYIRMYGNQRRRPLYQVVASLIEIAKVGILAEKDGIYTADEDLFYSLRKGFAAAGK